MMQMAIFVGLGVAAFGLQLTGSWYMAIPLLICGTLAFMSLGLLAGSVSKTVEGATSLANFFVLPMAFLAGSFFPLDGAPPWLNVDLAPAASAPPERRHARRDGAGKGPGAALMPMLILLGFTVVVLAIASRFFTWRHRLSRQLRDERDCQAGRDRDCSRGSALACPVALRAWQDRNSPTGSRHLDATLGSIEQVLDLDAMRAEIADLGKQVAAPDLWDDQANAQRVTGRLSVLQSDVERVGSLRQRLDDTEVLVSSPTRRATPGRSRRPRPSSTGSPRASRRSRSEPCCRGSTTSATPWSASARVPAVSTRPTGPRC